MIDHISAFDTARYRQKHSNLARSYIDYVSRIGELECAAENALECLVGCVLPAGGCDDEATIAEAIEMLRSALSKSNPTQKGE